MFITTVALPLSAFKITIFSLFFNSFNVSFSRVVAFWLGGGLAVFKISATLERAIVTAAAFRIFHSPVSTPVTISNLEVMAKLKPFSSTAVCVLSSSELLKLIIHFFFKFGLTLGRIKLGLNFLEGR